MEKVIEYDGRKFCRDEATGYYLCSSFVDGKRPRLHVYVWEMCHGPVPAGYHVHHKNRNKATTDIRDLELKTASEHLSEHHAERIDDIKKVFEEKVRPKGAAWHKTEEGLKFHRENKHTWKHLERYSKDKVIDKICEECSAEYQTTLALEARSRFCSDKCKAKNRRKSGVDDIDAVCAACGCSFRKSKYSKAKTCSRKCGGLLRRKA